MGYVYEDLKPQLFTDEGQRKFLQIRDHVKQLIAEAGAVRLDRAIAKTTGDSWLMLACIDRLVELEEIYPVGYNECVPSQHQVFTNYAA